MSDLHLNFLPWRQRQAARRRRVYLAALVSCAILPGLVLFVAGYHKRAEVKELRAQVSTYARANQTAPELGEEVALLARQIEDLQVWLAEIDQLEQRRGVFGVLWSDLAAHLPDSMHFSSLFLAGSSIGVHGLRPRRPTLPRTCAGSKPLLRSKPRG